MLIDLSKGKEELKQWITLNVSNFRENEHRPIMSKPEQVFTDIVVDKITSNFPREADDVQTLIGMCMHAKELIEKALPLLEIQGVHRNTCTGYYVSIYVVRCFLRQSMSLSHI